MLSGHYVVQKHLWNLRGRNNRRKSFYVNADADDKRKKKKFTLARPDNPLGRVLHEGRSGKRRDRRGVDNLMGGKRSLGEREKSRNWNSSSFRGSLNKEAGNRGSGGLSKHRSKFVEANEKSRI